MKKIGVVGCGIMGSGMVVNFLKNDYPVFIWNRSAGKVTDLESGSAIVCDSPKAVAENADIVFEVTANDQSSREVWTSDNGILAGAHDDSVLIASATLSIDWIDELIKTCSSAQRTFFDMALTGGRIGAESGNLTLLVGGDEDGLESLKPTLEAIAGKVFLLGPTGHGMRYKLLLNTLQAIHLIGFGEVMKIAEAHSMDRQRVGAALVDRPGGVMTEIANNFYHQQPDPITFSVDWITKDLEYARQFANATPTTLLDDVLAQFKNAQSHGDGDKDWSIVNEN